MKLAIVLAALTLLVSETARAATTITYDELGRLSTVCYDNSTEIVYSYDAAGNRTQVVIQGCVPN